VKRGVIAVRGALAIGFGLAADAARASDDGAYLFGDWSGARTRLADDGMMFDFGYVSEAAHNFSGGTDHLTRYTDQWKLGAAFDLNKLVHWQNATFQIYITDRNGRNLGADAGIGNNQLIQEVYGRGQTWHLTVFALDQKWLDGVLDWRIGRLPVGEDIASFSCNFQNLTFCGAQPGNIVGDYWVNWPTSQWATRLKYKTSADTFLQLAAYQLNPLYVDDDYARHKGLTLDNPGTNGWLLPLEFGWTPKWNGLPGSYKAGVWYNTEGGSDLFFDVNHAPRALTGDAPLQRDSRYGAYVSFQQQLTGSADAAGWLAFFRAAKADTETSSTDRQITVGGEYHQPFGRINDFIGIAVGATHANGRLADYQRIYNAANPNNAQLVRDGDEYVTEVFYSFAPIPSIQIRPNLQYIHNPGGTDLDDAVVIGLKTVIAF
jgi:porin